MYSEINKNNILAHVSGLTENTKSDFKEILKKSKLYNIIKIIDLDELTDNIINDDNIKSLYKKYNQKFIQPKLNKTNLLTKNIKEIEKRIYLYWKVKMQYYINKIVNNTPKKIILIGYISFYKNHKIHLDLNINRKFFVKLNHIDHAKSIIDYNLKTYREDIINGEFDLSFLDLELLIKKRISLENIYKRYYYFNMNIINIINIIELSIHIKFPSILYYASFVKYDKQIPVMSDYIFCYTYEWVALTALSTNSIMKKIKNNNNIFITINKTQYNEFLKPCYIYEITNIDNCLPYPSFIQDKNNITKYNVYKYVTIKPLKFNRFLYINNIIKQIKNLNIYIII